jgi:TolB-like protein
MEVFMTRFIFLAWAAVTIGATVSVAAPTTAPSPSPASVTASPVSHSSVLVLPFAPIAGASQWIGNAVQEDLATELARHSRLDVLAPANAQAVSDAATASRIGRDKGASLVAFGTYQIVESELRINGELIDTASAKPLAAQKTTGSERALFQMEDQLAAQAVASLPPALIKLPEDYVAANRPASLTPPADNDASASYNSQGFYITPGPDYVPTFDYNGGSTATTSNSAYAPSTAAYSDDYPWYDDDPFWGDGLFFTDGFGDHRHDHDPHRIDGGVSHTPQSLSNKGVSTAPAAHNPTSNDGFHTAGSYHGGGMHH